MLFFIFFTNTFVETLKKISTSMWVNKDNIKLNHIVPQLNWAITKVVIIVVVIISHQYGG
ncbi:hypothetical protein QFZ48_003357 [Chitinophaga sp. W2I13]